MARGYTPSEITAHGNRAGWTLVAIDDFDGDGGDDLLYQRTSDGLTQIYNGDGGLQLGMGFNPVGGIVGVGDVNNDGAADIIVSFAGGNVYRAYSGSDNSQISAFGNKAGWTLRAVEDFDADGGDDLLFQRDSNGRTFAFDGEGGVQQSLGIKPVGGIEAIGDLNDDGAADLIVRFGTDAVRSYSGTDNTQIAFYGVFANHDILNIIPSLMPLGFDTVL